MTVSTTTNKISYTGNGVAVEFAIPFPFLDASYLKAYQLLNNIRTQRTDWEIQNGNLVFETAPVSGAKILIIREIPLTQETDYRENEILAAETLERNFDRLTMQIQQLEEKSDRAVTVDMFDETQAADLLPSIHTAVSNAVFYAQTANQEANRASNAAETAVKKAQEASETLDNKADKTVYASKSVRGVARWGESEISETTPAVVVFSWHENDGGCRVFSDGFSEQWGKISFASGVLQTVNLPKPMSNTQYAVTFGVSFENTTSHTPSIKPLSINEDSFQIIALDTYPEVFWRVCGY